MMTVPESASGEALPSTSVFYGAGYADRQAELQRGLDGLSSVSVAGFRPVEEVVDPSPETLTLVFTDSVPESDCGLARRPAIWVTTDNDVAAAAVERGVTDVFNWSFEDGWSLLETKLGHTLRTDDPVGDGASVTPERPLQRISDGVLALDDEFRVTYLNNAAADLLVDRDDYHGGVLWEFLPEQVAADLKPVIEQAVARNATETAEVTVPATDQWFEVTAYPSAEGVSVYSREVTQRKERETQRSLYEQLIKTVGDGVYLLDERGRFEFVNDALCEMTDYTREELVGSHVGIIKDDQTVQASEDALAELLSDYDPDDPGMPLEKLDIELVTRDGTHIPCTDRMTLRPFEDGEFAGTVGTLRDISRQRRRQNVLNGILQATQGMFSATTADEVADIVVDTVGNVFEFDIGAVRVLDSETDRLEPLAASERLTDILGERPAYALDEGRAGRAFAEDELIVEDYSGETDGAIGACGFCPVGDRHVLSFGTTDAREFTDDDLRLVELLAETAAAAFDRVEREQELYRYEAVIETAEDELFTVTEDGQFTLVTEPFADLVGVARDRLLERNLADVVPESVAGALLDETTTSTVEAVLGTGDDRVPARLMTTRFEGPYGSALVGTARDISDLRSAQQAAERNRRRFAELFETLSDPVADIEYAPDGPRVSRVNATFAGLCGESAEALRDRPLAEVQATLPDALAEAIDPATDPGVDLEREVDARTGADRRHFILKTVPYESEGGQRAFVLLTDVTELKQRQTHEKVLHRLLRHNLRNETTVIQGYAESIAAAAEEKEVTDHAERILDASSSLVEASDTARTIQRVLGLDPRSIESVPVEEAASTIADHARDHPADVEVTVDTDDTVAYSPQLMSAIDELLENAVEHGSTTPDSATRRNGDDDAADGERPDVTVELTDGPRPGTATVRVADDGPGIPREEWEVVAGSRDITQLQHTQGLGLWLVKWVVDKHGGELTLESAEDGTTVAVTLPR